ncbi:MAG TPA: hypothetical protein VIN63_02160 [Candidatus Limnocylindria bacterium]
MTALRSEARDPRWVVLVGLLLAACVASTNESASQSPASEPTVASSPSVGPGSSPPISVLPSLDPVSETFILPDEFAPTLSYVSPDGRFVAARARDYGRVVLYRITKPSPRPPLSLLTPVAEVRGYAEQISWLEDSSAVLVGTDLDPTRTLQNHDPSGAGRRIAILNIDGRVVIAPDNAREVIYHRAHASPDGRWIWVADRCCAQQILLLSRDGREVRKVVPPASDGASIGFVGWDRDGYLLYWEAKNVRSTLVAVDPDGVERYRVPVPTDFRAAGAGVVISAPDRSWLLVEFGGGIGSSFRARRLLVGRDLRTVPDQIDRAVYGPFALGDEIVFGDNTGTLRAYQPLSGRVRDLPVRLEVARGPSLVGISDGYFVWMELIRGYVADVQTGRKADLPLQRRLNVSIVEGARLAEYHFDDNSIVIFDLAMFVKQ